MYLFYMQPCSLMKKRVHVFPNKPTLPTQTNKNGKCFTNKKIVFQYCQLMIKENFYF